MAADGSRPDAADSLRCPHCSKTYAVADRSNFNRHLLTHTGERPHTCDDCGASFTTSSNLKRHATAVHQSAAVAPLDKAPAVDRIPPRIPARPARNAAIDSVFVCPDCEVALSSQSKLRRHQLYHCPFRDDLTLGHSDDPGTPTAEGGPGDFVSFLHGKRKASKRPRAHLDGDAVSSDSEGADCATFRPSAVRSRLRTLQMCCVCSQVFCRRRLLRRHVERCHPAQSVDKSI
jgi:hypothetical protein